MVRGTVASWDPDAGVGLLASADLPGDVHVQREVLRGRSRDLAVGTDVLFDYEVPEGNGSPFRAVWVRTRPVAVR